MRQLVEWILDASFHHILVVISFQFDIVCCQALLQAKANLCKCSNLGILGDPGADKGGKGKSKRVEKYIWNEEK